MNNEIILGILINLASAFLGWLFSAIFPKARDYRSLFWIMVTILLALNTVLFVFYGSIIPFFGLLILICVIWNLKFRGPGAYVNRAKRFVIEFPEGWVEISFFKSLSRHLFSGITAPVGYPRPRLYSPENPEFYGPAGEELRFSIGPSHPSVAFEPTADEQLQKMRLITAKYGHGMKALPHLRLSGRDHAVFITIVPFGRDGASRLVLKHYMLVFNNTEYFISALLKTTHPLDGEMTIGKDEVYDRIVSSFHPLSL